MAALQEIIAVSRLLDEATIGQANLHDGELTEVVGKIEDGTNLIFGVYPYQRRATGVEGRLLTDRVTRQPVLAIKDQNGITPLPYAEDIINHPLRKKIESVLVKVSLQKTA